MSGGQRSWDCFRRRKKYRWWIGRSSTQRRSKICTSLMCLRKRDLNYKFWSKTWNIQCASQNDLNRMSWVRNQVYISVDDPSHRARSIARSHRRREFQLLAIWVPSRLLSARSLWIIYKKFETKDWRKWRRMGSVWFLRRQDQKNGRMLFMTTSYQWKRSMTEWQLQLSISSSRRGVWSW